MLWRFKAGDDVGPVPPDGSLVAMVGEGDEPGTWEVAWDGRAWMAWWHELAPADAGGHDPTPHL